MKVKTAGITDEIVLAYSWRDDGVTWTQESGKASRNQVGGYTLTPEGDKTRTKFDLALDPTRAAARLRHQAGHERDHGAEYGRAAQAGAQGQEGRLTVLQLLCRA